MEYMQTEQVADILKVSPQTIRQWASNGQIPYHRVGKYLLFTPDDINAAVQYIPPKSFRSKLKDK